MQKSELYFYLSIFSIVLTFTFGIGLITSIILLILVISEKNKLVRNFNPNEISQDLKHLNLAQKLNIFNIAMNIVLIILAVIFFLIFMVLLSGDSSMWKFFGS